MKSVLSACVLILLCLGCRDDRNGDSELAPDQGESKVFALNPLLARDRFPCIPEKADQFCFERNYEKAINHECVRIYLTGESISLWLTSVTCWKPTAR